MYAAVSESEVICDLRCGLKAKGTHLWASVFEGVRNTPICSPPVTSLARRSGLARRARAASNRILLGATWLHGSSLEAADSRSKPAELEYGNRRERQPRGGPHGS
jgi:hypothetical protein